jgi:site-specific recombinase XerD
VASVSNDLEPVRRGREVARAGEGQVPELVRRSGPRATKRFLEYFAVCIRNPNTRQAYARAVGQFLDWCDRRGVHDLAEVEPMMVAAYLEQHRGQPSTVKQHPAAIRMVFHWLVVGQIVPTNPATSVQGPRHIVHEGKTPVLAPEEARQLLDSIPTHTIIGLRDRALIAVMVFSFARISTALVLKVVDYYTERKRSWLRLHENGGREHKVPVHHKAEECLDAYLEEAGTAREKGTPLSRAATRRHVLYDQELDRVNAWQMIKWRVRGAGLEPTICNHSFRATGITAYLRSGGTLEKAQQIAGHSSPRTTKLYDRTRAELTLDEIEKIQI